MSTHCVIWAVARVGSTALGRALDALNEPFQLQDSFADADGIGKVCATRQSIKHLYEECPDASNLALAHAADANGYRHIHLIRHNELARLVSRDIATQTEAWTPEIAAIKFNELKTGRLKLRPLDVEHLLRVHRAGRAHWRVISEHLEKPSIRIEFEEITSLSRQRRMVALGRLGRFLALSPREIEKLELAMVAGGQNTQSIWELVPNMGQLRQALATGELL